MNELSWGIIGLILTIMTLSYLIGDNVLFRLASHSFIGVTAGYMTVLIIHHILLPYLIFPMVQGSAIQRLWMIIPIILILLLLASQIPRYKKLGSFPLAFLVGLMAAVSVGGAVFGTLIPQVSSTIRLFDPQDWFAQPGQGWIKILDAVVILIGVIGTLSFFHFGRKRNPKDEKEVSQRPVVLEGLSKIGQVFVGITLGSVFAGIFFSALMALIERIISIRQLFAGLFGG
jgi:hypothetical protein